MTTMFSSRAMVNHHVSYIETDRVRSVEEILGEGGIAEGKEHVTCL